MWRSNLSFLEYSMQAAAKQEKSHAHALYREIGRSNVWRPIWNLPVRVTCTFGSFSFEAWPGLPRCNVDDHWEGNLLTSLFFLRPVCEYRCANLCICVCWRQLGSTTFCPTHWLKLQRRAQWIAAGATWLFLQPRASWNLQEGGKLVREQLTTIDMSYTQKQRQTTILLLQSIRMLRPPGLRFVVVEVLKMRQVLAIFFRAVREISFLQPSGVPAFGWNLNTSWVDLSWGPMMSWCKVHINGIQDALWCCVFKQASKAWLEPRRSAPVSAHFG